MTDNTTPPANPYPEHAKVRAVQEESQSIGNFLDWLSAEHGVTLCRKDPAYTGDFSPYEAIRERFEQTLAAYFGIDLDRLEAEKQSILDDLHAS